MKSVELLSPAKNLATGIVAINAGADAVYIGAPKFGARHAAGNSLGDINQLISYAHKYHAKVYVALNTILFDHELEEAQQLVQQIYEQGADALIIQDMGILEMDLPPISIHASTQADNRTIEKVHFHEKVGVSRVVLARELSLEQISEIRANTTIELESFIHGSLCVSYSGQCYLSCASGNRSGNRGECAQPCRLPYTLLNTEHQVISDKKHWLSLKDMNQSNNIESLILAGVNSLKIEGRLKEESYVKNVTLHYRKAIDKLLDSGKEYKKASLGSPTHRFEPDPEKSFNRGFSTYFMNERTDEITSEQTSQSLGKYIGMVDYVTKSWFSIIKETEIHNGDGFCFFNKENQLTGLRVNKVEDGKIYVYESELPAKNTKIYRNFDHQFEKQVTGDNSIRKINTMFTLSEVPTGFSLHAKLLELENTISVSELLEIEKTPAQNIPLALETLTKQLSKSGDSIFEVIKVEINTDNTYFVPAGKLNELRRNRLNALQQKLLELHPKISKPIVPNDFPFPEKQIDFNGNVSNRLAEQFYQRHGVEKIEYSLETNYKRERKVVFTSKHCIKYQLKQCYKHPNFIEDKSTFPKFLVNPSGKEFLISYDCKNCEMNLLDS